jgi:hypothetical protein
MKGTFQNKRKRRQRDGHPIIDANVSFIDLMHGELHSNGKHRNKKEQDRGEHSLV